MPTSPDRVPILVEMPHTFRRWHYLRVAGQLKGKLAVEGDVTIESGAVVDGEVKAASVTVAPGAHMRGSVEFGWAPE
jgi:cytoskeletal protein CcmA (bactofilin family)